MQESRRTRDDEGLKKAVDDYDQLLEEYVSKRFHSHACAAHLSFLELRRESHGHVLFLGFFLQVHPRADGAGEDLLEPR